MDAFINDINFNPVETKVIDTFSDLHSMNSFKKDTSLKCFHLNIRSLSKNYDELKIFLKQLNYSFDCIVLTETFNIAETTFFDIEGYKTIYNNGKINKNDGVVIYIRENIDFVWEKHYLGDNCIIQVKMNICGESISITSIYRPPATCPREFIIHLNAYLGIIKKENNDHNIVIGDININILEDNDPVAQDYLDTMAEFGFVSTINKYTRIQGESKSCIDHLFVDKINDNYEEISSVIFKSSITDHFSILLALKLRGERRNQNKAIVERTVKYIDYKKLKTKLSEYHWADLYNTSDVNKATEIIINRIKTETDQCTTILKKKRTKIKRKCWITEGLVKSVCKKNELYKKIQRNPENIELVAEYKRYRNKLSDLIQITKASYYKKKIEEHKDNCKVLWKTVKEIDGSKSINKIKTIMDPKGTQTTQEEKMCEIFNDFFVNIGKDLASKINPVKINKRSPVNVNPYSIFLAQTNKEEIRKTILSLKDHKAPGLDQIKSEILKEIVEPISQPLCYLINRIFTTGVCPDMFKTAVVKPIYKSGEKNDVSNYRPISLVSNICKIFEKILKERMNNFFTKHNILSDKQFGFREGKSTQDAIACLTKEIYQSVGTSKPALCVFLDLSKAFDTVCHAQLIECLETVGFRGTPLSLMKSYLSDRKQLVEINGAQSKKAFVQYGVPQGTVLGPILFTLYVNELLNLNSSGKVISFADDTALFYTANSWAELKTKAEIDLGNIKHFFDKKLLTINFKKTKFIPFASYKNTLPNFDSLQIKQDINNFEIEKTNTIKYLGVHLDSNLHWDTHITSIVNNLRGLLYKFKFMKSFLDVKSLKTIYYGLIESRLRYGIIGWGSTTYNHIKQLLVIQKKILKIMLGKENTYASNELFQDAQVLDIRQLYFLHVVTRQYSYNSELKPIDHIYETRYKQHAVKTQVAAKSVGQRSHAYLAPRFYNYLPLDIKNSVSLNIFKRKVKHLILEKERSEIHRLIESK